MVSDQSNQIRSRVGHGRNTVQLLQEQSRVKPGLLPRWPRHLDDDLGDRLLLLELLPPSSRHHDLLHLAFPLVHYRTWTTHLQPLAPLLEPCTLHTHVLLGLFWVPFTLGLVLRTADTPARRLIKKS